MTEEELNWVSDEVKKYASFKRIIYKRATAVISLNVGPGAFGLLFMKGTGDSFELSSLIGEPKSGLFSDGAFGLSEAKELEKKSLIDEKTGEKNCGSRQGYYNALNIFLDAFDDKCEELYSYYDSHDYESYAIRVHALKSSAYIIGCRKLGDLCQKLEDAGKSGDVEFVKNNHDRFMVLYGQVVDEIEERFGDELPRDEESGEDEKLVMADDLITDGFYSVALKASEDMDLDALEDAFLEIKGYTFSREDKAIIEDIKQKADNFDYDGIIEAIKGRVRKEQ